jgi:transposase-like protein
MMTFQAFMATFPDETACRQFLADRRWPKGVTCPRCGKANSVYALKKLPFRWECANKECRKGNAFRFSVTAGTIFADTKVPILTWFKVLYTMLQAKKGISSLQIRRMYFGERSSTHTAWYVCHRLRAGMREPEFRQLMGIVEVDETFVGGKEKNKHLGKRNPHNTAGKGKAIVIGAIERKGNVVCKMIANADRPTMMGFVREMVSQKVTLVATDEHRGYDTVADGGMPHGLVKHGEGQYVVGAIHTNTIESFWSLLKRGVMGSYHHVSEKYLPLYLNEFAFRFNHRKDEDIFGKAIAGC